MSPGVPGREWWREAVVYQIYPRSFNDSDGDGIGDIPGIVEKLEYLEWLGVDAVWLNPVYGSPNADTGYDISDYRAIMDEFGTMADWERLAEGLHERGMRLIMDLVVNHTSDEHEWFVKSRESIDSEYREYYYWREGRSASSATSASDADGYGANTEGGNATDGDPRPIDDDPPNALEPVADVVEGGPPGEAPPNNWESIFGGPAWTYDEATGEWYLHLFDRKQPDLNWGNPDVREEVFELTRFWLDRGIDGFRLDAIDLISKAEGLPDGDPDLGGPIVGAEHVYAGPKLREYLREFHEAVFAGADAMTVGEAMGTGLTAARTIVADDGSLDAVFHDEHLGMDVGSGRFTSAEWNLPEFKRVLTRWQEGMYPDGWNAPYLGNHDHPRIVSRFGNDGEYRYESATMLATLLLTLRGTPFLYQGDEIGMTNYPFTSLSEVRDVAARNYAEAATSRSVAFEEIIASLSERSRDNSRTPMQWSDAPNAGFTDGAPWIPVNPNYDEINVEAARTAEGDSILEYYRELIDLRHGSDVLVYGRYDLLLPDHGSIYAYTRTLERGGGSDSDAGSETDVALVILNFDDGRPTFEPPADLAKVPADLLANNYATDADRITSVELRPYEARVYRVE